MSAYLPDIVGQGYGAFWRTRARYRVVKGSRASKKSKTAALWYIANLLKYKEANLLVVRKTYRTLERSAFAELKWAMARLGVSDLFSVKVSPLEITHKGTGQKIFFAGLDDPLKLTSITTAVGVLCWLWIEEAYEIDREADFDTLDESVRGEVPEGLFKQITLTFNPWSGDHWLKARFFDTKSPEIFAITVDYRLNEWLDDADRKLFEEMRLRDPERYRVCGLGEWGIGGGRFFSEFSERTHVLSAQPPPVGARIYRALDYGLDALACLYISLDSTGHAYVFREVYAHDRIVSEAAADIRAAGAGLDVYCTFAPPDLWSRQKDSGKSIATLFGENGVPLTPADNRRIDGWLALKEWLKVAGDETGHLTARLTVSAACENLIRCLSAIRSDEKRLGDCAVQPHELTHLPDALRYFAVMPVAAPKAPVRTPRLSDFRGTPRRKNRF